MWKVLIPHRLCDPVTSSHQPSLLALSLVLISNHKQTTLSLTVRELFKHQIKFIFLSLLFRPRARCRFICHFPHSTRVHFFSSNSEPCSGFFSCCVPIVHGVHCSVGVRKKCQNFLALLSLFIKSSIVLFTAIKRVLTVATIFLILFHPVKLLLAFFFGRESWELFSCDTVFIGECLLVILCLKEIKFLFDPLTVLGDCEFEWLCLLRWSLEKMEENGES